MIIYQQPQPSAVPDFIYLGFGTSFDVKSKFSGYASLTADDFYIKEVSDYSTSRGSIQTYADGTINREGKIVKSYNASTGVLTCYARYYYRASDSNGTGDKVDKHINCECFLRRPTATNQMIDLGTNTSFNVSSVYSNYADLTVDNFCVKSSKVYSASRGTIWGYPDGWGIRRQMRLEKSYNAQTGVLTCYLLYYYQANDSNGTGDKVNQQIKVNVFLSDVELVSEEAPNYSKGISDVKKGSSQIQTVMLGDKVLWSSYGAFKFQAVGGSGFLKEQSPQKYTAIEKCLLVVSHMRHNTTMSLSCTGTRLYFKDYNSSSRYICTYVYLMEQGDTISASSPSASGGDLSSIAFTTIKPFTDFTFTDKGAVTQSGSLSFTADKECLLIETDVKYGYYDATLSCTGKVLQDTSYVRSSRAIHTRIYHMKKGDTYSTTAGGTTGIQYPHRGHQLTQLTF